MLIKRVVNKPFHTYNALYVSVSAGVSVPCMVVHSIMSQITNVMGFYTGYVGHVTKYACTLHEYPCGFVLGDDRQGIFDDQQSILPHGFVYISPQHLGISSSANQIS